MIWLGQNDQGTSRTVYAALMSSLVDRVLAALPDADIILVGTYDAGGTAIPVLVGAMEDVATARGLGFINLYETAGDFVFFAQNNYLSDGLHFNEAGGEYVGNLLFEAFRTNGQSLGAVVPEPGGAALILACAACCLRRRRVRCSGRP